MTKERKLAIEMWANIHDMLLADDNRLTRADVINYKYKFCEQHNLEWDTGCWFCQYIQNCIKCPLGSCGLTTSNYIRVVEDPDKDVRVEACSSIIKALGGSV